MRREKNKIVLKLRRLFSQTMVVFWFILVAVAGFYTPYLLVHLPAFKIKEVVVEGNEKIKSSYIVSSVMRLSNNVLSLNGDNLKELLNKSFGGRVEAVDLKRHISFNGTRVHVRVKEREAVAKVKVGNSWLLIDRNGNLFKPLGENLELLPSIEAHSIEALKEGFEILYREVFSLELPVKKIRILEDKAVLIFPDKLVFIPPLDLLSPEVSERLKIVYNLKAEKVDLRYGRFILVRN